MNPILKKKILEFNKAAKENGEKAKDLEIIVVEMMKLPYGQLKKVLTPQVMIVLEKYGYIE